MLAATSLTFDQKKLKLAMARLLSVSISLELLVQIKTAYGKCGSQPQSGMIVLGSKQTNILNVGFVRDGPERPQKSLPYLKIVLY